MTTARFARVFRGYVPSEQEEMLDLARYLDALGVLWFHCPNEAKRSFRLAMMLKLRGLKAGVPDVLIFSAPPAHPEALGVAIELKSHNRGAKMTPEQEWWLDMLHNRGWITACCRGADEAIGLLTELGFEKARVA